MILLKKAIRSMLKHKKAYISCIMLLALGVWTFTTMNTALLEIDEGKEEYYAENRLADAYATVSQIPKTALSKLEGIDGIKQVDGRLLKDVRVLVPDNEGDIFRLRMISTQIGNNNDRLNAYVYEGNDLSRVDDVLIGYDFYAARGYSVGDKVQMVVNQNIFEFNVMGSIYSPEYVYIVEKATELFSDTTKFNIAYVDENILMNMLGLEGAYNDLSFMLEEGYTYDDVEDQLEYELKKYGLLTLYEKKDMFSYLMMEEEISSGKSMSTTMPMAFVGMAAVVLYLMLKRIIDQDRTQIGILKAFGYSNSTILLHYLFYGLVTGVLGAILGLGISALTIGPYIGIYLDYYKMPLTTEVSNFTYYYLGGLLSIGGGILGSYFGAKNVIKLRPAEAMRPSSPKAIKRDITHFMPFLPYILNSRGFMAARNIVRNKVRSGFVIIGITFSFSMMAMIGMMSGVMDSMFFNQFTHVYKYDAEIVLANDVDYEQGVQAMNAFDEVIYAEGVLKMPVMIHKGHEKSGTTLVGIKDGDYLYKAYDDELLINKQIRSDGLVLGNMVAKSLDVDVGDYVYIDSPLLNDEIRVDIVDIVNQGIGFSGYMELEALNDLFGQDMRVNSIIVQSTDTNKIREKLVNSDQVVKVEDKSKTLELYVDLLASYDFIIWIMQFIAVTIGFTIIYNTAAISMSERSREYATLRVLGLDIKEVKEIMSFEYWIMCLLGIAAGIPFALMLNTALQQGIDIDAFSWPSTIPFDAYVIAAIGCVLAVLFANLSSVKTIKKLDLVEVLKERE